jgi:small basic protein
MLRNVQLNKRAEGLSISGARAAYDSGRAVMQTINHTTTTRHDEALFLTLPQSTLGVRLARAISDAASEIARRPTAYLRSAFLPENIKQWLPLRFASALLMLFAHPFASLKGTVQRDVMLAGFINPSVQSSLAFVTNTVSTDEKGAKRRGRFLPILLASASLHAVFIGYLVYLTISNMFAPFLNISVVNKDYKPYEVTMTGPLYNPARPPRAQKEGEALTLEEIRERDSKRREEAERRKREKLEREKAEREKAEKERAEKEKAAKEKETQQKAEEPKTEASGAPTAEEIKKLEFNESALKGIVGKAYERYKKQGLNLETMNFSIMASFKIERDGTLSNRKIVESSGSDVIDDYGLELLHAISESHALGLFASLTSGTIRFDLNPNTARLTVTAFAPSSGEAENYAVLLKGAIMASLYMKKDLLPETKELLSLVRIKTDNKRINAEMTTSRARATEMMHARFDQQSQ